MHHKEVRLRQFITHFGKIPVLIIPVALFALLAYSYLDIDQAVLMSAMLVVALGLSYGIGVVIKFFYFKERPHPMPFTKWRQKINASAFPSIHTSNSFIVAAFTLFLLWQIEGIQAVFVGLVAAAAVLFYSAVSLSRIVLNKHFPADIFWGTALGIMIVAIVLRQQQLIHYLLDLLLILRQ